MEKFRIYRFADVGKSELGKKETCAKHKIDRSQDGRSNEWMSASRLRQNPTKTQVMWLGSDQQLKHVDINDIPVSSRERARPRSYPRQPADIIGTRHSALSTSTTMPARPVDDGRSCKNRSCGVYILSVGLL